MSKVAICAGCGRTVQVWYDIELGGDVWEPWCEDCPRPDGDGAWIYHDYVIERETVKLLSWYNPDDQEIVHFASSLEEACDAIDEQFARDTRDGEAEDLERDEAHDSAEWGI